MCLQNVFQEVLKGILYYEWGLNDFGRQEEQAGAELYRAQLKLGLVDIT